MFEAISYDKSARKDYWEEPEIYKLKEMIREKGRLLNYDECELLGQELHRSKGAIDKKQRVLRNDYKTNKYQDEVLMAIFIADDSQKGRKAICLFIFCRV